MLRAVDANLDRLNEGLRVLEDVARFVLNDAGLSKRLRSVRHQLSQGVRPIEDTLVSRRDVRRDVEAPGRVAAGLEHRDIFALVRANARRVEESLRVLEEFSRLSGAMPLLPAARLEHLRYQVYELDQELAAKVLRRDKTSKLAGVYLILDTDSVGGRDASGVLDLAVRGGVRAVQLRDKRLSRAELVPLARKLRRRCRESGVLFVVNDYVDIALAVEADGVHLGQDDLPAAEARRILPADQVVGCTVRTVTQARRAELHGADYVAVGSVYPTPSKAAFKLVGVEGLRRIRESVSVPVIAIGGIGESRLAEVAVAGATGVAVISAILGADDIEAASSRLVAAFDRTASAEGE